ncbi:hypothetical protein K438DRAFT_1976116 [Mycena galopus ATCC 62051]|nr:hypothetical protein K438DRAFT_1976116 [Mycena galopus ATCC 62051]
MSSIALPRRTLRSELSAFDLALGCALTPPVSFDFSEALKERLAEQDVQGGSDDEHEDEDDASLAFYVPPPLASLVPPSLPHNKNKSKVRHNKKRDQACMSSGNPLLKRVHLKRIAESKAAALEVDLDGALLSHSRPAWLGSRAAQDEPFAFTNLPSPHDLSSGLGGVSYTQEEVDALSGTKGSCTLTIPVIDSQRRVVTVLGGMPRNTDAWTTHGRNSPMAPLPSFLSDCRASG